MNVVCIFSPIRVTQWVSAAWHQLAILYCLLHTIEQHSRYSSGYSSNSTSNGCATIPNRNDNFRSGSSSTVCDILYFLHGSPCWSPYYNSASQHHQAEPPDSIFCYQHDIVLGKPSINGETESLGKLMKRWKCSTSITVRITTYFNLHKISEDPEQPY